MLKGPEWELAGVKKSLWLPMNSEEEMRLGSPGGVLGADLENEPERD